MRHSTSRRAAAIGALAIGMCFTIVPAATAQHISRWVDDRGVLHFSTSPPPPGVAFESMRMTAHSLRAENIITLHGEGGEGSRRAAPALAAEIPADNPTEIAMADDARKAAEAARMAEANSEAANKDGAAKSQDTANTGDSDKPAAPKATGPARVVAKLKETQQPAPSARELKGTVKNVGGAAADNVFVSITVFEDGQGNECFHQEVTVDPSSLAPGESATFTASFDDPCFFGEPRIDIVAEWQ
jgi:hypothetical protein